MHKNLPQAMLHNYFYDPPAGSIKIAQLCKIAALPTLENQPAYLLTFERVIDMICLYDKSIKMRRTISEIESSIRRICNSSFPYEWDENHISFQLMKELRTHFSNRTINFQSWSKIVDWKSYKNKGNTERKYGDISLLVNVQFSSGETLKGVAFLEAKRSYNSSNFEAIEQGQLVRIKENVPYAQVLLYNHKEQELQLKFPDENTWRSHFWVSPINTAQELNEQVTTNDNWKLLRTSFPFSSFLTSRIFWGFDLDFRTEIYNDIESGLNKLIESNYLGVVNVYYDNQSPIDNKIGENWEEI